MGKTHITAGSLPVAGVCAACISCLKSCLQISNIKLLMVPWLFILPVVFPAFCSPYAATGAGPSTAITTFELNSGGECEHPQVLQHPSQAGQTICPGEEAVPLTVEVSGTGLTYQWYASATAGNTGGTPVPGATGTEFAPPVQISGTRYYYAVVSGTCGSATSQASGPITVRPYLRYRSRGSGNWNATGSWQQFNGQDWVNASSWPGSIAPVCSDGPAAVTSAEIRMGHTITVNADYTFGDITVHPGGTLIVSSGKRLTVPGEKRLKIFSSFNLNLNSSVDCFSLNVSGGNINLELGSLISSRSIRTPTGSININSGAHVTCDTLDVTDGSVNITAGGRLTCAILDARQGTVNIDSWESASGSLIVTGSSAGDQVSYNRYVPGGVWQLLAAPVSGQPVSADWAAENFILSPLLHPMPPPPEEGGYIPYEFIEYHEGTNQWVYFEQRINQSGTFEPGRGFGIQRDGDGTISFTGNVQTGEVLRPVSRTPPSGRYGWNLTGNPYPSAISLEGFLADNSHIIDQRYAAVYFKQNGRYTAISGNPVFAGLTGQDDQVIQAGQGFFIRAAHSGNLSFSPALRLHEASSGLKSALAGHWPGIRLTVAGDICQHSTIVAFHKTMTEGTDPGFDIGWFPGQRDPEIYTLLPVDPSAELTLQSAPPPEAANWSLPVGVRHERGGWVTFSATILPLEGDRTFFLEDRLTGSFVPLDRDTYTVWLQQGTRGTGRFFLRYLPYATAIRKPAGENTVTIRCEHDRLIISGDPGHPGWVKVTSVTGSAKAVFNIDRGNHHVYNLAGFAPGIYLVTLSGHPNPVKIRLIR